MECELAREEVDYVVALEGDQVHVVRGNQKPMQSRVVCRDLAQSPSFSLGVSLLGAAARCAVLDGVALLSWLAWTL